MHIATVLLLGVENDDVAAQLTSHGYGVLRAPDIDSVKDVKDRFVLIITGQEALSGAVDRNLERLRFFTDNAPVVVLLTAPDAVDDYLLGAVRNGSVDCLFTQEVSLGLVASKMDGLFLTAQLNANFQELQTSLGEREALQAELTFRNRILEHQRSVNAHILESVTSGLVILDIEGTVITVNDPAVRMLALKTKDLLGADYRKSFPRSLHAAIVQSMRCARGGEAPKPQKVRYRKLYLQWSASPLFDSNNQANGVLLLINDITEQEEITLQLYQAEKLATVGTMLSGIAHELRNPLSIISGWSQRALSRNHDSTWLHKSFTSIQKQSNRCATLVNNLLNFARNTAAVYSETPIADILDETLTYATYQKLFESIEIHKEYECGLTVWGDRSRFVQIFLNLITNAADAMNGKGVLILGTYGSSEQCTAVSVSDTGPGIPPAIRPKIFDPFFTTKETGKGTGLGLAIVYKIVAESGGSISVESEPGNTTFVVRLPQKKEMAHG